MKNIEFFSIFMTDSRTTDKPILNRQSRLEGHVHYTSDSLCLHFWQLHHVVLFWLQETASYHMVRWRHKLCIISYFGFLQTSKAVLVFVVTPFDVSFMKLSYWHTLNKCWKAFGKVSMCAILFRIYNCWRFYKYSMFCFLLIL